MKGKIYYHHREITKCEINSREDSSNTHNLMRRISNTVEHNESLEQVTSKLGKTVKLISLGIGGR